MSQQPQRAFETLDDWQRAERPRDVLRFAPIVPLSTAGGCAALTLCLWPVLPDGWQWWLVAGALLALLQWFGGRLIRGARNGTTVGSVLEGRRWTLLNGLVAGVFWGVTSVVLFPAESAEHQLLLAFVLMAITSLWLPLFAVSRFSFGAFAVPGLLPMAFALLSSPYAAQTTMGSLFLLVLAAFALLVRTASKVFFAEHAVRCALYHEATHDPLVGLANRRELHRRMQTLEIMQTRPYTILYIDLDHFKEVNDSAGHAAGDELLRRIGTVLRESVRQEDTAARLGGDEFAVLMQDCGADEAAQIAVTVLQRINGFALSCGDKRRRITASIGIACSADLFVTPGKLLEAADRACYAAKRSGRNRVEVAAGADAEPLRHNRLPFAVVSDALAGS
jgi:diguanylate cyclase (GGDEF)-like protein